MEIIGEILFACELILLILLVALKMYFFIPIIIFALIMNRFNAKKNNYD